MLVQLGWLGGVSMEIEGHWSELGSPTEPGDYLLRRRYKVRVRRQDIELAKARGPDARFGASRTNFRGGDFLIGEITSE
jgi:hypothetical protein